MGMTYDGLYIYIMHCIAVFATICFIITIVNMEQDEMKLVILNTT